MWVFTECHLLGFLVHYTEPKSLLLLMALFFIFIHFRDENLSGSELTAKLEPAFLSGLRCAQPLIRAKFFEVFDNSMKRRVYERLLYVTCSQNWEAMGNHFWIKQCIEVGKLLVSEMQLDTCFSPYFSSLGVCFVERVCIKAENTKSAASAPVVLENIYNG